VRLTVTCVFSINETTLSKLAIQLLREAVLFEKHIRGMMKEWQILSLQVLLIVMEVLG